MLFLNSRSAWPSPPDSSPLPPSFLPSSLLLPRPPSLPWLGRAALALCDWQLAAKMVMLVFLLNPGKPQRLATLCVVAALAYLYQVRGGMPEVRKINLGKGCPAHGPFCHIVGFSNVRGADA